jgi:hypothetical protein
VTSVSEEQAALTYYETGMGCPSPGCPHLLYRRSDNIEVVRCLSHGPMKDVPVIGEPEAEVEGPS